MKIAVYGGTGNVGSRVVAEAARRGHVVTALSRHSSAASAPDDGVTWALGDAGDLAGVQAVAAANDAVVSALGPSREPDGDRRAFLDVIRGLAATVGTTRLLVVGGAGSLLTPGGVRLVDTPDFPDIYRPEALVAAEALEILRATPPELDWTFLSPAPEIGPGERTGSFTLGDDEPAGGFISFEDFAVVLVDEIEAPAHRRARFTAAN